MHGQQTIKKSSCDVFQRNHPMPSVSLSVFAASNGMWKPSFRHATWGRALPRDNSQNTLKTDY